MNMSANNDSLSSRLYVSRKILLDQLDYLGYDISEYSDFSVNDIYTMNAGKQLSFMVTNNIGKKKYIYYHVSKALRPAHIHELIEQLFHIDEILDVADELCIITKDIINDTTRRVIKDIFREDKIHVSVRSIQTMQHNILKHTLVPKHTVLSDTDKEKIFKKYNIAGDDKLPEISQFDPVAIILGLRQGQVCEITRPNKTSLDSVYYRICC
jgi:DNA-directed RNA polymerase subunit H (RpoH/RPB5)